MGRMDPGLGLILYLALPYVLSNYPFIKANWYHLVHQYWNILDILEISVSEGYLYNLKVDKLPNAGAQWGNINGGWELGPEGVLHLHSCKLISRTDHFTVPGFCWELFTRQMNQSRHRKCPEWKCFKMFFYKENQKIYSEKEEKEEEWNKTKQTKKQPNKQNPNIPHSHQV